MAHSRHQEVRRHYNYRCGYCGVSETECGGELTIDHFRPVSAGGDDGDNNLVYCCFRCNGYKADFHPSPDDIKHGFQLLHPLIDSSASHFQQDRTGLLVPLTAQGAFHLKLLHLNRPLLVELRLLRVLHDLLVEDRDALRKNNVELRRLVGRLEQYLEQIRRRQIEHDKGSG